MINITLFCRGAKVPVIGFQADMQEFCSTINVMRHRWFHCHRVQIVVDVLAIDCSILLSSTFVASMFKHVQACSTMKIVGPSCVLCAKCSPPWAFRLAKVPDRNPILHTALTALTSSFAGHWSHCHALPWRVIDHQRLHEHGTRGNKLWRHSGTLPQTLAMRVSPAVFAGWVWNYFGHKY